MEKEIFLCNLLRPAECKNQERACYTNFCGGSVTDYLVINCPHREKAIIKEQTKEEKKENKDEKKANEICLNHENIFDAMEEYHKYKCSRTCADVKDEIDDVSDEPPKE